MCDLLGYYFDYSTSCCAVRRPKQPGVVLISLSLLWQSMLSSDDDDDDDDNSRTVYATSNGLSEHLISYYSSYCWSIVKHS
jgi:hypothetical protein